MIRAYDVLNPTQEKESVKNRGLFDTLGDFFTEVKEGASSTNKADEMFNIAQKLQDPTGNGIETEEDYEKLKTQYNQLRDERQQSQRLGQEARKRLEDSGHDWIAATGSLGSSLPDMVRTVPMAIAAGIPTGGLGTAATIATGIYGAYRGGRGASIEAFEKVLDDGGSLEQAMDAYNNSILANSIAEAPGEALTLVGAGRLAKMLGRTNTAQKILKTGAGKIGSDFIKDPAKAVGTAVADRFGRTAGRAAGVATHMLGDTATEELTEHFQNYNSDIQAQKAMGKDTDFFDMNNFTKYLNSDEAKQTTKDVFFSTLALGGAPAAITSNQMLGKGYSDAEATKAVSNAINNSKEILKDIDKEKLNEFKNTAKRTLGIDIDEDNVFDAARTYVAQRNAMDNDYSEQHSNLMLSEFANYVTGSGAIRPDYTNEKNMKWLGNSNLEGFNQGREITENTETASETAETDNHANGVIDDEINNQENTTTENNKQQDEAIKMKVSRETKESLQNDDGRSFTDKVAEQGTTEPNRNNQTNVFKQFDRDFTPISEGAEGGNNKAYDLGNGQRVRITANDDGSVSVTDLNNLEDTVIHPNWASAYNDVRSRKNNGKRRDPLVMRNMQKSTDGVIADKDNPEKSGETKSEPRGTFVNTVNDFLNWYDSIRGTEQARQIGGDRGAFELARILGTKNFDKSNISFIMNLGREGYFDANDQLTTRENAKSYSVGGATFLTPDGKAISNTGSISDEAEVLRTQGVQKAIIQLFSGADVVTAMHEMFHVGFWNMTEQQRRAFYIWAPKTQNSFAQKILRIKVMNEQDNREIERNRAKTEEEKANIKDIPQDIINTVLDKEKSIDVLTFLNEIKAQDETLYNEVMGDASFAQTFELLKYQNENIENLLDKNGRLPDKLQEAMEERWAWEGSLWYVEGYRRGIQPRNILERIWDRICRSLGTALGMVYDTSERLNEQHKITMNGQEVNYTPIESFSNMSIQTRQPNQQQQVSQGQEDIPNNFTGLNLNSQGEQFNPNRQNGIQNPFRGIPVGGPYSTENTTIGTPYTDNPQYQTPTNSGYRVKDPSQMTNQELLEAARITRNDDPYGINRRRISKEMSRRGLNVGDTLNEVGQYTGGENQGEYKNGRQPSINQNSEAHLNDINARDVANEFVEKYGFDMKNLKTALQKFLSLAKTPKEKEFAKNVIERVKRIVAVQNGGTEFENGRFYSGTRQTNGYLPQQGGITNTERDRIRVPWDTTNFAQPRGIKRVSDATAREIYEMASNGDENAQRIFSTKIPIEQQKEIINEYESKRKEQEEQKRQEELKKQEEERKKQEEQKRKEEEERKKLREEIKDEDFWKAVGDEKVSPPLMIKNLLAYKNTPKLDRYENGKMKEDWQKENLLKQIPDMVLNIFGKIEAAKTIVKGEKAKQYIVDMLNKQGERYLSHAPEAYQYKSYFSDHQLSTLKNYYKTAFGRDLVKDYNEWENKRTQNEQQQKEEDNKKKDKKPRKKGNETDEEKEIAKLNTVEDIINYMKKIIKEEFSEEEVQEGAKNAVNLTQNKVYFYEEDNRETSQDHALFEDILDNKKPRHASLLAKTITKRRGNLKEQGDKTFLIGIESSLRKLDRLVVPKKLTQEWIDAEKEINSILENIINPFLNDYDDGYYNNDNEFIPNDKEIEQENKKEEDLKNKEEQKKQEEIRNKQEEEKKKRQGNLSDEEYKEYEELSKKEFKQDENGELTKEAQKDFERWRELSNIKDGIIPKTKQETNKKVQKSTVRHMKVKLKFDTPEQEKQYNKMYERDFRFVGSKIKTPVIDKAGNITKWTSLSNKDIEDALKVRDELQNGVGISGLYLRNNKDLTNFEYINKSILSSYWQDRLNEKYKNTLLSRGIFVDPVYGNWCEWINFDTEDEFNFKPDFIKEITEKGINNDTSFNLSDIIDSDEYFKHFPEAKTLHISFVNKMTKTRGALGGFYRWPSGAKWIEIKKNEFPIQMKKISKTVTDTTKLFINNNDISNNIENHGLNKEAYNNVAAEIGYRKVKDNTQLQSLLKKIEEYNTGLLKSRKDMLSNYTNDLNKTNNEIKNNSENKDLSVNKKLLQEKIEFMNKLIKETEDKINIINYLLENKNEIKVERKPRKRSQEEIQELTDKENEKSLSALKSMIRTVLHEITHNTQNIEKQLPIIRSDEHYWERIWEIEARDSEKRWNNKEYAKLPPIITEKYFVGFLTGKNRIYRDSDANTSSTRNQMASTKAEQQTQERVQQSQQILDKAFPNVRFQYAWHSTPHDFDAFTLDHLLEGEGRMAYGWGLYFAKSLPKNYENYFKRFNKRSSVIKISGKNMTTILDFICQNNFEQKYYNRKYGIADKLRFTRKENIKQELLRELNFAIENSEDRIKEINNILNRINKGQSVKRGKYYYDVYQNNNNISLYNRATEETNEINEELQELRKRIEEAKKVIPNVEEVENAETIKVGLENVGKLLRVDIPNDDVLIRKDARFKDQPKKVQIGIVKFINKVNEKQGKSERKTLEQVMREMGNKVIDYDQLIYMTDQTSDVFGYEYELLLLKQQEELSKELNKLGIKGVSYNGYRDGECVVVFDNKAIDIINKFKKEEGKWVSDKPQSQKQELTDTQKQRIERKLQEKRENQPQVVTRFMKQELRNYRLKDTLEREYKNEFYSAGRKAGFETKRITDAFKVVKFLTDTISRRTLNRSLLYLNPKDETMLAQRVKDFMKLNHKANEIIWEKTMKDKKKYPVDGIGAYRNFDGKWMVEFDDNKSTFDTEKIYNDIINSGGLTGLRYKLSDIFKHDELYKRHPEFKNIPVYFIDQEEIDANKNAKEYDGVNKINFAAAYSFSNNAIYVNSEDFFNGFALEELEEQLSEGSRESVDEAISGIKETLEDMHPFILHELQHAIQHKEKPIRSNANRVIALVLHNDLNNVLNSVKDKNLNSLAKEKLDSVMSTIEFLEKNNKTEEEEKLQNLLDDYMERDEFYYTDLDEIEAYDTQHRFGTDGKSLPLTKAERNAYQNAEKGEGLVYRHMSASKNENLSREEMFDKIKENQQKRANTEGKKNDEKRNKYWSKRKGEIARKYYNVYSVTFDESSQENARNKELMKYFEDESYLWKKVKNKDKSITYRRETPMEHHTAEWSYSGINGVQRTERKKSKLREWIGWFKKKFITKMINDRYALFQLASKLGIQDVYKKLVVLADQSKTAFTAMEEGILYRNKDGKMVRTKALNQIIRDIGEDNQTDFLDYCIAFRVLDLANRVKYEREAQYEKDENGFMKLDKNGKPILKKDQYGNTLYDTKVVFEHIKQKMSVKEANDTINKVKKNKQIADLFETNRKAFVEYNHALLQVTLLDGGIINKKGYEAMLAKDPNFVPLEKIMDDEDCGLVSIKRASGLVNTQSPLYKMSSKGSVREVKNPLMVMQQRTAIYYSIAAKNKAGMTFINEIANKVTEDANGNKVALAQGIVRKVKVDEATEKLITQPNSTEQIIYVFNNGQKEFYQIADRDIFNALHSMDSEQWGTVDKILDKVGHTPAALVRATATSTPDFGLRNVVRDTFEAWLTSEHGFVPLLDSFWGMYQYATNSEWAQEYHDIVGEYGTLNREGEGNVVKVGDVENDKFNPYTNTKDFVQKQWKIFQDAGKSKEERVEALGKLMGNVEVVGKKAFAGGKIILSPFVGLYKTNKKFNDMFEQGTRIAEYRNAKMGYTGFFDRVEKGGFYNTKLKDAKGSKIEAAYAAKDITLNFEQHGEWGKRINRYVPFFNASMQGIYKMCNALELAATGVDTQNNKNEALRNAMRIKIAIMVACAAGAAMAGQGDDDYDEAPEWEKENFWIFSNGFRIPRDQVFGRLIGYTVERGVDQALKGKFEPTELLLNIGKNFTIDKCVPTLLDMAIGYYGNYDTFKKQPITPEYMAERLGYLQSDIATSNLAKNVSEAMYDVLGIDVGAKKIDWVMRMQISNMAKYANSLFDLGYKAYTPETFNEKMARGYDKNDATGSLVGGLSETPIFNTFTTNRKVYQSVSDFQQKYHDLKVMSSDESKMTKEQKREWKRYQDAYKKFMGFQKQLKAIKQNNKLSGTEKREKADKIFQQQIKLAQWAER